MFLKNSIKSLVYIEIIKSVIKIITKLVFLLLRAATDLTTECTGKVNRK